MNAVGLRSERLLCLLIHKVNCDVPSVSSAGAGTILPGYCPLALLLIMSEILCRGLISGMDPQGDPCRYDIVPTASVLLAAVIRGKW